MMEVDENVDLSNNIVAVMYASGVLGVACYNNVLNEIHLSSIHSKVDELEELFSTIKTLCKPSFFLIHPKIAENGPMMSVLTASPSGIPDYYSFKVEKRASFNSDLALQFMNTRVCIKTDKGTNGNVNFLRQASSVDTGNVSEMQVLSALLIYLEENVFTLDDKSQKIIVNAIKPILFDKYMYLDASGYNSLQIFHEDSHPNMLKGICRCAKCLDLI